MYDNRHHAFAYQYNHCLFYHVSGWGDAVFNSIMTLKPGIVKTLDPNVDNLRKIKENRPDTFVIYRLVLPHDQQVLGSNESQARDMGEAFAQRVLSVEAAGAGLLDAVEGYNERLPTSAGEDEHRRYNAFMIGFAEAVYNQSGSAIEPIWGNFATGNGDPDLFSNIYGSSIQAYRLLGVHEYDWPTMDRLHRQGIDQDGNEGKWLALRYQRDLGHIVSQGQHTIIVTECGMTQGVLGGNDIGPWANSNTIPSEPWKSHPSPITADAYWATLQWYNAELLKDPAVMGACLFVTGAAGGWDTFEHIPAISNKIASFQAISEGN